ncbi:hypothetical protein ACFSGI_00450 [Paenibacillus nicotianae]|uniref:Uncharacterized protein n=1 Tax=Paenibacillus nicotianae TaxID=1526551 RepID=A0ABW4UQH7_9BACL
MYYPLRYIEWSEAKQIEKGNMAIAQLLRSLIIGISFVIGTFVM